MKDQFYLVIYKTFFFIISKSSKKSIDKIVTFLANIAYFGSKKRRDVIFANLDLCFENLSTKRKKEIAIYSYKNLLYNIVSFFRDDYFDIEFKNSKSVKDLIKDNKKVIFITAHFGVWELLPKEIVKEFAIEFAIVGRELDSKPMQKILKEAREKNHISLINKRGAMRGMIKAISSGKTLGLLVDQSLLKSKGGVEVIFCDKKALQTSAVSILAKKFDALIVPIFIYSDGFKKFVIETKEPISIDKNLDKDEDIKRLNQEQADVISKMIKEHPNEWFWSHKRFKDFNKEIYG